MPQVFAKFAGIMIEHEEFETKFFGREKTLQRASEKGKAQIREIYEAAAKNDIRLRLWTPDATDFEFTVGRALNIYVGPDWVVPSECYYDPD